MGNRGKVVKTYGRHRQRTVVADPWSSEEDKNVFSCSSASSDSSSLCGHPAVSLARRRGWRNEADKENMVSGRLRTRTSRDRLYSDKDSLSSVSSECIFEDIGRRVTRRALQDSNRQSYSKNTAPNRTRNKTISKEQKCIEKLVVLEKPQQEVNFSDFDEYSLVLSLTPVKSQSGIDVKSSLTKEVNKVIHEETVASVETSTPLSQRPCSLYSNGKANEIKDINLSHINFDHFDDESIESSDAYVETPDIDIKKNSISRCDKLLPRLNGIATRSNSSLKNTPSIDYRVPPCTLNFDECHGSPMTGTHSSISRRNNPCIVELVKLRNSFIQMHINPRKKRSLPMSSLHPDYGSSPEYSLYNSLDLFSNGEAYNAIAEEEGYENDVILEEDEQLSSESEDDIHINNASSRQNLDDQASNCDNRPDHSVMETSSMYRTEDECASDYLTADLRTGSLSSYHTASKSMTNNSFSLMEEGSLCEVADDSCSMPCATEDQNMDFSFKEMITPRKERSRSICSRARMLRQCQQMEMVSFEEAITPSMLKQCVKIGEGVYGEVFRTSRTESVAIKIIPIEGNFPVNDEPQKTFSEILPEIIISRELSSLRLNKVNTCNNFIQVNRVSCIQGRYPGKLLDEWDAYHHSENDRPDIFNDDQLFVIFEFADGGCDLESFKFQNICEARAVLQQVAVSLAVAEQAFYFEHRDLHWGNVLVRRTTSDTVHYKLDGMSYSLPSEGIEVSIIDFTLSRLRKDGCTIFCDLSTDETLFEGEGDYQFDIYRRMKEEAQPEKERIGRNNWEPFNPHTNVMWLHYIGDKILRQKKYSAMTRADRDVLRSFRQFLRETVDNYTSALDVVYNSGLLSA